MSVFKYFFLPAFGSLQATPESASSGKDSKQFLAQAMQDSLAEIEVCNLALEKASDDEIKAFSQQMIDDHSRIGREIEDLANRKGVPLPRDVTSEQRSTYDELSGLSGQEFERKFVEHNVEDHEKDIEEFRQQSEQGDDPDIRAFAEKGAQRLSEHLKMAQEVGRRLHS